MNFLVELFARSRVAANVLMLVIITLGLLAVFQIRRATFPAFELEMVNVSIPYPGATAADVEASVVRVVEERLADIADIKTITSTSTESRGSVSIEFIAGADIDDNLQQIRDTVDGITTFPRDAEDPLITRVEPLDLVAFGQVHGEVSEVILREWAFEVKDRLIDQGVATQVQVDGARQREIHIEVSRAELERLDLGMEQIAAAVRGASIDLPAGTLRTGTRDYLIRVAAQRYQPRDYLMIPVRSRADGSVVTIGDIASVRWRFEDVPRANRYNGEPSLGVTVLKTGHEDVLAIDARLKRFLAEANGSPEQPGWLPDEISYSRTYAFADLVKQRLSLLTWNGLVGLVLVLAVLWFFTSWRISLWVAVGLFTAGMGTIFLLESLDRTIDMISMFALIMSLGILVDDAIIVAENIHSRHQRGETVTEAAVNGAKQVAVPVLTATATTIAAFLPLAMIPGHIGTFMLVLPITIAIGLSISLVESFLILPHHLAGGLAASDRAQARRPGRLHPLRARIDGWVETVIERGLAPLTAWTLRWRYLVLALALGLSVLALGMILGLRVPFRFFPQPEGDVLVASVRFPVGTPVERTTAQIRALETALAATAESYAAAQPTGPDGEPLPLVLHAATVIGGIPSPDGGLAEQGGHVGGMTVILRGSEDRGTSLAEFQEAWRRRIAAAPLPGLSALLIQEPQRGPGGTDIDIRFTGRDWDELQAVAGKLREGLAEQVGVINIDDDLVLGKPELRFDVSARGRSLGVDQQTLGQVLRGHVFGTEVERFQRGRDEVTTRVIAPEAERSSLQALQTLRLPTAAGRLAPLAEVSDVTLDREVRAIHHYDRKRVVSVTAELTPETSTGTVLEALGQPPADPPGLLQRLSAEHGVSFLFEGVAATQAETMGGLRRGFVVALVVIYLLLVLAFRSWLQPITILMVIPTALVGGVLGHLVMGLPLTIISIFGLIGLIGIAVNDAITLIHFINQHREQDLVLGHAVIAACKRRFRPIVMTTATTVAGLLPILLERSLQAQFLIPMATAISFGLLVATFGTLVVVPAFYVILQDLAHFGRWIVFGGRASDLDPAQEREGR